MSLNVDQIDSENLDQIQSIITLLEDKKGNNISLLDMREHSISAQFFLIADGDNPKHIRALADNLLEKLEEKPYHKEGLDSRAWVVLDYGELWVHIFQKQTRQFYDLDGLWADSFISREELEKQGEHQTAS